MKRNKKTKRQRLRAEYAPERWVLPHSERIRTWSLNKKDFHWPSYLFLPEPKYTNYIYKAWITRG